MWLERIDRAVAWDKWNINMGEATFFLKPAKPLESFEFL